jgi:hypothetical protein
MMFRAVLILFSLIAASATNVAKIDEALLATAQKVMPREILTNQLVKVLNAGLWNSNQTAIAISIYQPKASVVFVFLRQANGTYLAADASKVEEGNFGKLGRRPRTDYDRFETTPTEWLHRKDGLFQVLMRTRAWERRSTLHRIRTASHQAGRHCFVQMTDTAWMVFERTG